MSPSRSAAVGALLLGATFVTGCASESHAADVETQTIRLIIPDGNLRPLGTSCAGAGPYRFAHQEAPFAIEDGNGNEVARGVLPAGTSEKIMDVDFGAVKRQPTMCVMLLKVDAVRKPDEYLMVIDGRAALPIKKSDNVGIAGEVVVS
ncbi:hypothetical protein [Streptosporangium sp. NPDC087985]|uniref:hypothetical protein n=1 Tax=Streptosporangium sp. NPDC087985 TaxID=3366196 RepID=UPI0038170B85